MYKKIRKRELGVPSYSRYTRSTKLKPNEENKKKVLKEKLGYKCKKCGNRHRPGSSIWREHSGYSDMRTTKPLTPSKPGPKSGNKSGRSSVYSTYD
jgi:transposase